MQFQWFLLQDGSLLEVHTGSRITIEQHNDFFEITHRNIITLCQCMGRYDTREAADAAMKELASTLNAK